MSNQRVHSLTSIPPHAPTPTDTMVGLHGLAQYRHAIETVLAENIQGDLLEAGVWRGGASIWAVALLDEHNALSGGGGDGSGGGQLRRVWLCDSFRGLPPSRMATDIKAGFQPPAFVAVSVDSVLANMRAALGVDFAATRGLPSSSIAPSSPSPPSSSDASTSSSDMAPLVILEGYFNVTMPTIPPRATFSIIRLDGDLFESYMDVLFNTYDKLAIGGYIICDDMTLTPVRYMHADVNAVHHFLQVCFPRR